MNTKVKTHTLRTILVSAVREQNRANKAQGGISNTLLVLARGYQKAKTIGKCRDTNTDSFDTACKVEESYIKSTSAGKDKVNKIPRAWTQPKSNIRSALRHGIDLAKYNTESELRKAVLAANKAARGEDVVADAMSALKKSLDTIPEHEALAAIKAANLAIASILEKLVPNEPKTPSKPRAVKAVS